MARESNITFEQVAAAAESLKTGGNKATSRAIRDILGTGSMATICKHLAQWQSGQTRQTQAIDNTLDPAISRAISSYLATRVQDATATVTAQLADLQAEAAAIIVENEKQAAELDAQTTDLQNLQDQCAAYSGRILQLESDATRQATELAAERTAAEAARVNLAKAELRLEAVPRIEAEIAQVRADLAAERIKSAEQHEQAAVAIARHEAAQAAIESLQTQLAAQRVTIDRAVSIVSQSDSGIINRFAPLSPRPLTGED